jgi:hypothetical protein
MYAVATTDEFDGWFADLGGIEQSEIIAKIELLKILGHHLRRPHADTLNGSRYANMKELRADTAAAVIRIAFAFDPSRKGILLIGGNKSGVNQKRFYKDLVSRADALYERHLVALKPRKKKK